MGRLFVPGQVVSAENQGTFSDYHYQYDGYYSGMLAGVNNYTPQACGCFDYGYYVNNGLHVLIGSRLSKN